MQSDLYTFEHDGKTYTFERPFAVVRTPKWLRANRRRDELDLAFTVLETIGGDEVLDVIDSMTEDEFKAFAVGLNKAMSATFQ